MAYRKYVPWGLFCLEEHFGKTDSFMDSFFRPGMI